ncbi:glycosyl transferase [Thioalkalivibrio denitrificans]|uniref:Glycosyl transferase n=1 Tax=Thioalkalivibrio denitrificans TaxID=108003 RepID=A0A1V3NDJ8_9GAMM|nr:glycosyltransferase [Thioalkalivibrio denitrificans]OOG23013.1 glycosyl transferase [Thioalkalivibrio denitrificans]
MTRLAVLAATSGHSGVDRILGNLLPAIAARGIFVDLLQVRGHGPLLEPRDNLRLIDLGGAHVATALPGLVRYLRRERPEVLLTDKDRVNRMAILATRLARVPLRHYVRLGTHVSTNLRRRGRLEAWRQRRSIRRLYPRASGVLVPSQGVADDLAGLMGGHGSIHVVPSPIVRDDLEALAGAPVRPLWPEPAEGPLIVAIGELSSRKDHATLLRAFARVRAQRPCRLLILGEGRQRANLEALATQLGIDTDLRLPGFVANPYPYLAQADVLAHSARWEGMGIVLVEALALGKPVVSTDCPSGPREVLAGGQLGGLVPVGDDVALAQAIQLTLDGHTPDAQTLRRAAEPYRVRRSVDIHLATMQISPGNP